MYLDEAIGKNQRCRPEGRRYKGPACQRSAGPPPGRCKRKRDSSLRKPTASSRKTFRDAKGAQERKRKKKSACSVPSRKTFRDAKGAQGQGGEKSVGLLRSE